MDSPYGDRKYEISQMCLQSYPCQHDVRDMETGVTQTMSGDTIYKMLKKEGLTDPHFEMYSSLS